MVGGRGTVVGGIEHGDATRRAWQLPDVVVKSYIFLQGVKIASYASPVLAVVGMSVRPSLCPSHAGTE